MIFSNASQFGWLVLVAALAALAWLGRAANRRAIVSWMDAGVVDKVFPFHSWKRRTAWRVALTSAGFFFLVVALAGPKMGRALTQVQSKGGSLFILFDCSDSMLAEDFKPNRMDKSKRLLSGLLDRLGGQRAGIIVFAGEPYVYCPLTFDLSAARQFLRGVEAGMAPVPGTRIGAAVRLALSKMPESAGSKTILLLTDGEDHESDPLGAAEEARKAGVTILAVGVGNPEGEPIPVMEEGRVTGYRRNEKGDVVLSRMDESTLSQMAAATGGVYVRATPTEQELDILSAKLDEMKKGSSTHKQSILKNRYQWALAAGLLCLALAEATTAAIAITPGSVGAALAVFILCASPANATFNGDLRAGNRKYSQKKYSDALKNYESAEQANPRDSRASYNKGNALYRLEDWDAAAEAYQKSGLGTNADVAARSWYNLGNAQFQKGDYGAAVKSYQQALRLNASDEDAKHNLRMALRFKQNPPPKQQQAKQGKKDQKDRQKQESAAQQERKENAKRALQSAAGDQNAKPVFRPDSKDKKKKRYEQDW